MNHTYLTSELERVNQAFPYQSPFYKLSEIDDLDKLEHQLEKAKSRTKPWHAYIAYTLLIVPSILAFLMYHEIIPSGGHMAPLLIASAGIFITYHRTVKVEELLRQKIMLLKLLGESEV